MGDKGARRSQSALLAVALTPPCFARREGGMMRMRTMLMEMRTVLMRMRTVFMRMMTIPSSAAL